MTWRRNTTGVNAASCEPKPWPSWIARVQAGALTAEGSAWLASAALGAYDCATMSRDLSLYDSGELALAAAQLGLGHPPGQPLHTLLGYVAAHLAPSALVGINLVSALPSALSIVPAARIARFLCAPAEASRVHVPGRAVREFPSTGEARTGTRTGAIVSSPEHWLPWLLALFALHWCLWEPATRVEVYTLATLAALWAIALALPLCAARGSLVRGALGVGVALGLCASVNPVIAAATGCGLLPALLVAARTQERGARALLRLALGGVLGLLPYLYLPLVAAHSRVLVWGGLHDADSYLRYLTLRDYARNQTIGLADFLEHARLWGAWSVSQLLAPTLIVGLGGFIRARLRAARWLYAIAFGGVLSIVSFNVGWHLDVPDYNGYLAVAYWLAAAGSAALFATSLRARRFGACAAIVVCLGAGVVCSPALWMRTRHVDRVARTLTEQVLQEAPADAIVISSADYFAGSLFYLQEAESRRPDVAVLAYGLAGSSWHWRHLFAVHPELTPVDLQKRGPRAQRVRAFLAANPERPVLIERYDVGRELGLELCPGGVYLRAGTLCRAPRPSGSASDLLAEQLQRVSDGSPSAAAGLAEIGEQLGAALWRLRQPEEAHAVLLATVPRNAWPHTLADPAQLQHAAMSGMAVPPWRRAEALGEPSRNIFLAGAIVFASGQTEVAGEYVRAAARLGLPEARELLAATKGP